MKNSSNKTTGLSVSKEEMARLEKERILFMADLLKKGDADFHIGKKQPEFTMKQDLVEEYREVMDEELRGKRLEKYLESIREQIDQAIQSNDVATANKLKKRLQSDYSLTGRIFQGGYFGNGKGSINKKADVNDSGELIVTELDKKKLKKEFARVQKYAIDKEIIDTFDFVPLVGYEAIKKRDTELL